MRIGVFSQDDKLKYVINQIIKIYDPDASVIQFHNIEELDKVAVDLLLWDILLCEYNSITDHRNTKIIYMVDHAEEVNCFFGSNMLGFILKSNIKVMLLIILECYMKKRSLEISLPLKVRNTRVDESDILYFYVQDTIFYVALRNKTMELKIRAFQELLLNQKHFFQINRKCIVNLSHVKTVNKISRRISLSNGVDLIVSRRKMNEFMDCYMSANVDKILVNI